jgi:hypothetical protein
LRRRGSDSATGIQYHRITPRPRSDHTFRVSWFGPRRHPLEGTTQAHLLPSRCGRRPLVDSALNAEIEAARAEPVDPVPGAVSKLRTRCFQRTGTGPNRQPGAAMVSAAKQLSTDVHRTFRAHGHPLRGLAPRHRRSSIMQSNKELYQAPLISTPHFRHGPATVRAICLRTWWKGARH